jgi:hypothetical protein
MHLWWNVIDVLVMKFVHLDQPPWILEETVRRIHQTALLENALEMVWVDKMIKYILQIPNQLFFFQRSKRDFQFSASENYVGKIV